MLGPHIVSFIAGPRQHLSTISEAHEVEMSYREGDGAVQRRHADCSTSTL